MYQQIHTFYIPLKTPITISPKARHADSRDAPSKNKICEVDGSGVGDNETIVLSLDVGRLVGVDGLLLGMTVVEVGVEVEDAVVGGDVGRGSHRQSISH